METITPPKVEFMPKFSRHEPAARDSTSVRTAQFCLKKYFFTIVLGFRSKDEPIYLLFGKAYHKFREVLEVEFKKSQDEKESCRIALDAATEKWPGDPVVGTKFDFQTIERLIKSCMVGFKHWLGEKEKGVIEVLHPEQVFDILLRDGKTRSGGRADQMNRYRGRIRGRDFKTTSKEKFWYSRCLTPNDQFSRYTHGEGKLSGEQVDGQLVEVLHNSKKKGPIIWPMEADRTPGELDRWETGDIRWRHIVDQCRENDDWPESTDKCSFCEFHSVCKMGTIHAQQSKLEREFKQRPWNFKDMEE